VIFLLFLVDFIIEASRVFFLFWDFIHFDILYISSCCNCRILDTARAASSMLQIYVPESYVG